MKPIQRGSRTILSVVLACALSTAFVPMEALAATDTSDSALSASQQVQTTQTRSTDATSTSASATASDASDDDVINDELIVTYRDGARAKQLVKSAGVDAESTEKLASDMDGSDIALVHLDDDQSRKDAIKALEADPRVESVESNRKIHTMGTLNDPYADYSYYLDTENIVSAWDSVQVNGTVTVAVLDSGITMDADYPDADLDNVVDYDHAYDALTGRKLASSFIDTCGHGTAVASLISAEANNDTGIAGVSAGASILPVRVVDESGDGDVSELIRGYEYVLKVADTLGVKVINLSLGGEAEDDELTALQQCIDEAYENGIVTVAAAGNEAEEGNPVEYPAALDHVISVGAVDSDGSWASFSEYNRYVDLTAAGVSICVPWFWDTETSDDSWPGSFWFDPWNPGRSSSNSTYTADNYVEGDGTSFSTPLVSGVAALLYAADPSATASEIEQALEDSATDHGKAGRDNKYGYGEINATAALDALPTAQAAQKTFKAAKPRITSKKATKKRITVKWSRVTNADGYTVEYRVKGKKKWKQVQSASTKRTRTLTALKRKTTYQIRVRGYQTLGSDRTALHTKYSKTVTAKTK